MGALPPDPRRGNSVTPDPAETGFGVDGGRGSVAIKSITNQGDSVGVLHAGRRW
jgi:hypothetical protein